MAAIEAQAPPKDATKEWKYCIEIFALKKRRSASGRSAEDVIRTRQPIPNRLMMGGCKEAGAMAAYLWFRSYSAFMLAPPKNSGSRKRVMNEAGAHESAQPIELFIPWLSTRN